MSIYSIASGDGGYYLNTGEISRQDSLLTAISKNIAAKTRSLLSESSPSLAREHWSGKLDFLLSCIGFAVGLGNVWRFPYLCYRNGGGAFLIPYTIMLLLAGLPLFFLELAFGQYASLGPLTIWKISPPFKGGATVSEIVFVGLGWGMVIISFLVCVYYNMIITYTIWYLAASFTSVLPWASCDNDWNSNACRTRGSSEPPSQESCLANLTAAQRKAGLICVNNLPTRPLTPAEEYWDKVVLDRSPGIDVIGDLHWKQALVLLSAWILVFLCLFKGVKLSGRVVYFTATFPYLVLLVLFIRGITLPGAAQGIIFYLTPQWHKLASAQVWGDAAIQIFYSLGPAWGGLITMASYNEFHNNCHRDAIIVAALNCLTSIFSGFVIFSVLGFMSLEMNLPVSKVAAHGPGLAFIAYPEGLARMPLSPFWAICFFLMLLLLGLDSQFVMMETLISAFMDEFPHQLRPRKAKFTLFLCTIMFIMGLPCTTQGGIYIVTLMDWYCAGVSLMLISFCECIVITWIYGIERFSADLEFMLGFPVSTYWKICWKFVSPAVIMFILIFTAIQYVPVKYNKYVFPWWAEVIGWMLALSSTVMMPVWFTVRIRAAIRVRREKDELPMPKGYKEWKQFIIDSCQPSSDWGPAVLNADRRILSLSIDPKISTTTLVSRDIAFYNRQYETHV